jgi:WD40 repeat protein
MKRKTMNKKPFIILSAILILSACMVPAVPDETDTQPPVSPKPDQESLISVDTIGNLSPSITLQPSTGALTCSWAQNGSSIWVQDFFTVSLYDAATMDVLAKFDGGEYAAFYDTSADGQTVAYSQDGQEIRFLDIFSKEDRLTFTPGFPYSAVFFSPNGSILGVASLENIEVILFNVETGLIGGSLNGFTTAAPVYSADFGPDGDTLIWLSRGTVQPMSIGSGELGPSLSHEDFVVAVAVSPDGSLIATAAAGTLDGEFQPLVTLWDTFSGSVVWQNGNPEYFSSLDFSPDGSLLAAGTEGEVIFYQTDNGEELARLITGSEVVNDLGFSPDSTALLTCETDGRLILWKPN